MVPHFSYQVKDHQVVTHALYKCRDGLKKYALGHLEVSSIEGELSYFAQVLGGYSHPNTHLCEALPL